ncbi:HAD-IA family hydrolase [Fibrivirga algicola]|uniref:HAD-IA family hydrolase n=1 Tax=Fibrivirga algicola TaxID=2950420 RepID=A0ABX0QDI1_9BACT|nr:HAD-IA family hydrolase [Fibrivirga algicola]NID09017.1 HAD-IA family hydrolase [Fibrivirga algicola]
MKYKLVIFDFDGTLADSFPYFLATMNTLATVYNFPAIDANEVEQLRGLDARQLMKRAKLPAWKIPLIAGSFRQLMNRDVHQIQLFDGVPELLRTLASHGVKLAIVSSNSEENVRQVLGPDSASLISFYGCGTSLFNKGHKFKRIMITTKTNPTETLCVGDEVRDLKAAQKVATAFGGVAWGYTRPDALEATPGVIMFYTPDEITRAVLESC